MACEQTLSATSGDVCDEQQKDLKRIDVMFLCDEWKSSKGGLSTFNREFAVNLAKTTSDSIDVHCYVAQSDEQSRQDARQHGVNLITARSIPGSSVDSRDIIDWLKIPPPELPNPDIVVGHGRKFGTPAYFIVQTAKCKWMHFVHVFCEDLGKFKATQSAAVDTIEENEKKHKSEIELCKAADVVVTVGSRLQKKYSRSLPNIKVERITPGILQKFSSESSQLVKDRSVAKNFNVFMFGRASFEDLALKGYDIVANAIGSLDKMFELTFVGSSPGEHRKIEQWFLDNTCISRNQLTIRSYCSEQDELKMMFHESDMIALPSRTEGFGLVALEAISAGIPVLVAGESGIAEALHEVHGGQSFIVESDDAEVWARRIKQVSSQSLEERETSAKLLRESYNETYPWSKECERFKRMIQDLVENLNALDVRIDVETMKPAEHNTKAFRTPASTVESEESQDGGHQMASVLPVPSGYTQPVNEVSQPSVEKVLTVIADMYLKATPLRSKNDLDSFLAYMREMRLIITGVRIGSLLITVKCDSLQILERLWEDYSSGHLGEVVQRFFVTEEILTELSLAELKLKTAISEEEYERCKMFLGKDSPKDQCGNVTVPVEQPIHMHFTDKENASRWDEDDLQIETVKGKLKTGTDEDQCGTEATPLFVGSPTHLRQITAKGLKRMARKRRGNSDEARVQAFQIGRSSAPLAHGSPPVILSGRNKPGSIINGFREFLERLSLEIEQDQLEGLKFLLHGKLPLGVLEKCLTPRQLFTRMMQHSLLGEDNLDSLQQLFTDARRSDLAERVRVFKQSSVEVESEIPANSVETVCFTIGAPTTDHNVKKAKETLVINMCDVLSLHPSEICLVGSQEKGDNWFNLTFELPRRSELLGKLRWAAINKDPGLILCGVKAVAIGSEDQIVIQPIPRSLPLANPAVTECCHDDKKLDLILVIDCATSNPALLGLLKTQLCYLVSTIFKKGFHLRLALISYQNHQKHFQGGRRSGNPLTNSTVHTHNFTENREEMTSSIKSLPCFRKGGITKGLADGLASALQLSKHDVNPDSSKCRRDATKICILLPVMDRTATLEIYRCEHGHDMMKVCRQLAGNGVTLYTVTVTVPYYLPDHPALALMKDFFTGISLMTGGQYIQIRSVKLISEVVMYAIDEDVSLEQLFGTAYDIIMEKIRKPEGEDISLEELANVLERALNQRFCRVSLILFDRLTIGPRSKLAKMFSLDADIDDACRTFKSALDGIRQSNIATAPGTPRDADVKVEEPETPSPQVSLSTNHEITMDVSERMVRNVVLRKAHHWPR